jgi:hypothetical protein
MARKRRAPSPAPPQQSSSSEDSGSSTKGEGSPHAATAQIPPQNLEPQAPDAAADDAESSEEADAQASQMQPVSNSPAKAAATVAQPESDADKREDGDSDQSEPEVLQPVQKKAAATNKSRTPGPQFEKRHVPVTAPSGKAKEAQANAGKVAPKDTQAGNGKKAKAALETAPTVQTPPGKAENPGGKPGKLGLNVCAQRIWSKEDVFKILEALVGHVEKVGVLPKTDVILDAVHDHLNRKNCTYKYRYEKIQV